MASPYSVAPVEGVFDKDTGNLIGIVEQRGSGRTIKRFPAFDANKNLIDPETGSPVSGGGSSSDLVTYTAMQRLWGLGAGMSAGGGSNAIGQYLGKECLDAGVNAVRVWVFSKEPINESSGWEVIVAPTDQLLNDTKANAFYPQIGGTTYNFMAETQADHTSVANQYGWRRAQWGGQNNDGRAAKSGKLRPASNFRNQTLATSVYPVPGVIVSDWIDIKTVPASDGRHYMLWRAKKAAAVGETAAFSSDANPAWKGAAALPWYRRQFCMSHTSDAISSLTAVPAAPTEAASKWTPYVVAFEYRYNVPVRSVMACGDSITENGGNQTYGLNNWLIQSTLAMSTAAEPVVPINMGFSTSTYANFMGQLEMAYSMGLRPTDVIIPNVSFNDMGEYGGTNSGTQYLLSQAQARLVRSVEMIRRYGGKAYVTTDFHNLLLDNGTAAYNTFCADIYAFTLALGASGACTVIDWRAAWNTSLDDGVHATQAGLDLQAQLVTAALSA